MNKILSILFLALIASQSFADTTTTVGEKVLAGKKGSVSNIEIQANTASANKPKLVFDKTASKWQFSNDGTTFSNMGSGSGGGGGGVNLLTADDNANFEAGLTGWTASGGTTGTETATPLFGTTSATWDASALSQTFSSAAKSIPVGLQGSACLALAAYSYAAGTDGDLAMQVYDGTNVLSEASVKVSTTKAQVYAAFACPSSGTVLVRFIAKVANPGTIKLDGDALGGGSISLGSNIFVGAASQARLVGAVVVTGCAAGWSTASASLVDFPVQTGCSYQAFGEALAPTTNIPGIRFANLTAGEYKLEAESGFEFSSSGASSGGDFQFWDGTNTARETSHVGTANGVYTIVPTLSQSISYSSTQSGVTLSIRGRKASGTGTVYIGNSSVGTFTPLVIRVYKLPSAADTIISGLETSGAFWRGYHNNQCSFARTNTAYGDFGTGGGSCAVTSRTSQNISGVTVAAGTLPGITFTPPKAGVYQICARPSFINSTNDYVGFQLIDAGTSAVLDTLNTIPAYSSSGHTTAMLCGNFSATASSAATIKLYGKSSSGTLTIAPTNTTVFSENSVEWSILDITQSVPMPYVVSNTPISSGSNERIERATIANNGTATILRQSGSWLSSVNRTASGRVTVTFSANQFTTAPSCTVSIAAESGGATNRVAALLSQSNTSVGIGSWIGTTNTDDDQPFNIVCMGAK